MLDGYALDRNVPDMLDLMRGLLLDIDFSSENAQAAILELLEAKTSGALDSVAETGHHFAVASASSALSERGRRQEQLSGLSQIEATARLLNDARAKLTGSHRKTEADPVYRYILLVVVVSPNGLRAIFRCHKPKASFQILFDSSWTVTNIFTFHV